MSSLFCYLAGSLVFLAGSIHNHAPVEYTLGSILFALGSLAALAAHFNRP